MRSMSVLTADMASYPLSFCFVIRADRSQELRVAACEDVMRACACSALVLRDTLPSRFKRKERLRRACNLNKRWRGLHHVLKEAKVDEDRRDEDPISSLLLALEWVTA
jgi:hypothetical protein